MMRARSPVGLLGLLAASASMLAAPEASARMVMNPINDMCKIEFLQAKYSRDKTESYLICTAGGLDSAEHNYDSVRQQIVKLEQDVQRARNHYENNCAAPGEAERFRAENMATARNLRDQAGDLLTLHRMVRDQRARDVHEAWMQRHIAGDLNQHLSLVAHVNQTAAQYDRNRQVWVDRAERIAVSLQSMRPRQCGGPPVAGVPPGNPVHPQATANQWYVWLKAGEYTCCRAPDGRMPQPARWDWGSRIPAGSKVIGGPFADERAARAWMCGHQVNIAQAHIHNWAILNGTLVSNLPCANLANTRYK